VLELVIRPLADAFMQVGVFVALLVAPFGWARYRWGGRFDAALERHRRLGPLIAALLTVPPGCGGAIIVMSVYARGAVSYGAAVSALVATMGDACWVLLAADPLLTVQLKVLLVATGAATGYLVDALHIAPRLRQDRAPAAPRGATAVAAGATPATPAGGRRPVAAYRSAEAQPSGPAGGQLSSHAGLAVTLQGLGIMPTLLWFFLAGGLVLSLPVTFQLLDPAALGAALLGDVDPYLALGTVGTTLCLIAFVQGGCKVADDDTSTAHPSSMTQVLRHGGHEVAFVTVWVAAAYVAWSLLSHITGFDGSQLPLFGVAGVLVGALVGLIPGCAIQIVFAGIFLAGGMPVSTLVANTISQDGDALIPLLALEHRSALLATVLTTLPAIVVGLALLVLR
jgi:hypothetical protein